PDLRAVIFDWGGVFSPLSFFRRTEEWERRLGLPAGTLERVLWGREWKQLEIGALSQEAFDEHVARGLGLPDREAVRRFYAEYYADQQVEPRLVEAVRALRDQYRVALLTNAYPGHAEGVKERYGFDPRAEFDLYVNSAEVGIAKPDLAIYRYVLDRLGVRAGQAVFLDDLIRNTDAAALMGIHTVVFTDVETALEDLAALLNHPVP
ncbi:MAG TPA: HAD family phosphatase, partial [Chloroflexi bacterium]|nr:HAD family phosphatase [Chloroflexota bacterium]